MTQAYRLVNDQHLYGVAAAFSVFMFFLLAGHHAGHEPAGEGDGELCRVTADQPEADDDRARAVSDTRRRRRGAGPGAVARSPTSRSCRSAARSCSS